MKKTIIAIVICLFVLVGCTGGGGSDGSASINNSNNAGADPYKSSGNYDGINDSAAYEETVDAEGAVADETSKDGGTAGSDTQKKDESTTNKIDVDKLIYTCNISIDTKEFDSSVSAFRALIKKYGGFVENETEQDDGTNYYDQKSMQGINRIYTYTATVRIPSSKYDDFLNETGDIGDVRSKSSNVQNISQEYYDLNAELEVLQAKYDRYMEMLKEAKKTSDILEIENSITGVETRINQIKTQLNRYDNDVAYSFVNITIHQVREYQKEEATDFSSQLSEAFEDSLNGFVNVMEGVVIAFIFLLPYLVILLVVAVAIILIVKLVSKNSRKKKNMPTDMGNNKR